jgi:hypothetical protein
MGDGRSPHAVGTNFSGLLEPRILRMPTLPSGFIAPCLPTKADVGPRNQTRRLPHHRPQDRPAVNSRIRTDNREIVFAEHRCCERRKRHNASTLDETGIWVQRLFLSGYAHSPAPSNGIAPFRDSLFGSRPKAARHLRHRNSRC